jgi:four helix bundle protein
MKKLRPSGGYRDTASFQTTTIIYDATVWFCEKFLDARSRTVDQMIQAARSGRQNIAEGSRASATSSQTELRLVNVARSSLDELLLDYEDYLRQRRCLFSADRQEGRARGAWRRRLDQRRDRPRHEECRRFCADSGGTHRLRNHPGKRVSPAYYRFFPLPPIMPSTASAELPRSIPSRSTPSSSSCSALVPGPGSPCRRALF